MSVRWGILIGILSFALGTWPALAQNKDKEKDNPKDEPIAGKPLSEWLKILRTEKDVKGRRKALVALQVAGPKEGVVPALIEALEKDSDAEVRQEVVQLFGSWGPEAKGTLDALATTLKTDKSPEVREAAARAMGGKLAGPAQAHVLILAAALKDPFVGTRTAAAETLRDMGEKARPALPQLLDALKDAKGNRFTRIYAAQVIGKFADDVEKTAPVLAAVLRDTKAAADVRQACAGALGQLAADTAISDLAKSLAYAPATKEKKTEPNPPAVRRAALLALMKMGDKAKAAWPGVKKILYDVSGKKETSDPDSGVRLQAVRLAGMLGREEGEVVATLEKVCVKDMVTENRLAAIQELGQLGAVANRGIETLTKIADQDSRFSVREAAQAAIKKIKGS